MWTFRITIAVAILVVCYISSSCGQHSPFFAAGKWLKPPNQRAFQKMLLQRMQFIMDLQADPCEDFFQFACGNYKNMIPENLRNGIYSPGAELENLIGPIVNIYLNPQSKRNRTGTERKMIDYMLSCINSKDNLQSTADFVKSFGSWPALDSRWSERNFNIWKTNDELLKGGADFIFDFEFQPGQRDRVDVGIMSLIIDKSDFFESQTSEAFTTKIKQIGQNIIQRNYLNDMIPRVKTFFNQMRQISLNSQQKNNENEFYLHELQRRIPGCDFAKMFTLLTGRRYEPTETIIVPYLDYMEQACQLIHRTDKRTLADFMFILLLMHDEDLRIVGEMEADVLKTHCEQEVKAFFNPVLTGSLARAFVQEEVRQEIFDLTRNLQKVGAQMMFANTSWLDEHSRRKAVKKMEGVTPRIAYPDYAASETELWKLYSKVNIDTSNYLQNKKQLTSFFVDLTYNPIGKDFSNKIYETLEGSPKFVKVGRGTLDLPASSLLPPFYHKFAPSFMKHSTLLSVVGHELMHNFDVDHIGFDQHGKENQWMTANSNLTYKYRSECFIHQYGKFKFDKSEIHVNSTSSLDENLADNDGLKMAFELFKQWIAENPGKVWEEEFTFAPLQMTHEQAFFLGFAQLWCDARSIDKQIEAMLGTDEHAPNKFRVIGTLSNLPDFATAFNCPVNSKMNPAEKCTYFFD